MTEQIANTASDSALATEHTHSLSWLAVSVFLACIAHSLVAVRWTYAECFTADGGRAPSLYGGPIPDKLWAYTSLDWIVFPFGYALNIAMLALVIGASLYPVRHKRLSYPSCFALLALSLLIAGIQNFGPGAYATWSRPATVSAPLRPAGLVGPNLPYLCDQSF